MTSYFGTAAEASQMLKRFHCFHDAILSSFTVTSSDYFESSKPDEMSQIVTGLGSIEMRLMEGNLPLAGATGPKIVTLRFLETSDLLCDLRLDPGAFSSWAIHALRVEDANTSDRFPGQKRLTARILFHVCAQNKTWAIVERICFHFASGELTNPDNKRGRESF